MLLSYALINWPLIRTQRFARRDRECTHLPRVLNLKQTGAGRKWRLPPRSREHDSSPPRMARRADSEGLGVDCCGNQVTVADVQVVTPRRPFWDPEHTVLSVEIAETRVPAWFRRGGKLAITVPSLSARDLAYRSLSRHTVRLRLLYRFAS
ncbi:hypothetical protein BJV78DRAFT_8686 [Lactifluus subvellereus]|nr:hypothetical protein BJV78DRAFT_8686 [Lactifluus subvellereus]